MVCTPGVPITYDVVAVATNECGDTRSQASWTFDCTAPRLEVTKTAEPAGPVDEGTVVHYTITVTNPSKSISVEEVVLSDTLCAEATWLGNANPPPIIAPAVGSSGTIVWNPAGYGSMPPGQSYTITFDALVGSPAGSDCGADRSCTNRAVAVGYCGKAEARATAEYTTAISPCTPAGLCSLTGHGCLNEDGGDKGHRQSTFGGNAGPERDGDGPAGNSWEHVYRDGRTILFNWHSGDAHVVACGAASSGPCQNARADFVGTGRYSLAAGSPEEDGNMVAYIVDHRGGACNKSSRDEYGMVVRKGFEIGKGEIVFQTSGEIDCGNLQIDEAPARLSANGVTTGDGSAGIALLNKPYPNPFSGSTNFAYRVETDSRVEVGVYNVAGRLVKTLSSGTQPAGTYTVTWDGSDDAGVRMAPGVYFLKSRVGGDSTVSRVIYVAR